MVEMELTRILIAEMRDQHIIVLREKNGTRAFPIVIGIFEAMAIDRHVKEVPLTRPLTHNLLLSVIQAMGGKLERVVINDLSNDIFYGRLHIRRDGQIIDVDSRPSDAIALAVHENCPIFVEEHVLTEASGTFDMGDIQLDLGGEQGDDEGENEPDEPPDEDQQA